ncbi:RrF2 family transcriptional regulator [Patescibacteria group bacterium]
MILSTKSDYGLVLLVELAKAGEKHFSLSEIAKRTGLSLHYLEQIAVLLRRKKIVKSIRGTDGGYKLARRSSEITLAEIVKILDGEVAFTRCSMSGCTCKSVYFCQNVKVWHKLQKSINQVLEKTTLADFVK